MQGLRACLRLGSEERDGANSEPLFPLPKPHRQHVCHHGHLTPVCRQVPTPHSPRQRLPCWLLDAHRKPGEPTLSSRRRRPKHSRGEHEGEQRKQEDYDETEYGPNRSKPVANWPFLLGNPFAPTTPHRLSYEHRAKPDLPISAEANASRQRKKYSSQNKAVIARATDNPAEADRHNSDRNKRQQENTRR